MKVLYLMNVPSPYRVDFFNELGKCCDLTVLYERSYASDRHQDWKSKSNHTYKEIFLKGLNVKNDSAICIEVIKYLKKRYDHIVIGGYSTPTGMIAITFLKMNRIPFILNTDGGIIKNDKKIIYIIKKLFISSASAWLSTGEKTSQYLMHYGAKKKYIFKYPFTSINECQLNLEELNQDQAQLIKNHIGIKEKKIIFSVGQFIYRKGYDVLIKSMKYLPKDYGVYIVGGKPTPEYLQLKERYKLDNLHFIDFMNMDKLSKYYQIADIFVLPTREDIWGLVINEALAFGLPIITTNNCLAGLELVKPNLNGDIVEVGNSELLAESILSILESPELCKKMSQNSKISASQYTIEKMAETHINIFEQIKYKK